MNDSWEIGFGTPKVFSMKTEYANEVLQSIDQQEFYDEVIEYVETEVFDDIMDFMQNYCPEWYKNLGTWASEFIQQHISDYIDLYDNLEMSRAELLSCLYWDLDQDYQDYYSSYETIVSINEAYRCEFDYEESED